MTTNRIDSMALFVTAIDTGSLSAAARECGLSLSSVSRHLTMLEERIGTRLMIRSTRMLGLTEAGRAYYEQAKRLIREISDLESSLASVSEVPTGKLSVIGPSLFGRVFMLPILAEFLKQYPQITLDLTLVDRPVNLVEKGIDLAIFVGEIEDSTLAARKLGELRWVISASPTYLQRKGVPENIADLCSHDCLVYGREGLGFEWQMLVAGAPTRVQVPVRMRSNSLDGVVLAALTGAGLVCAPAWAIADHVATGHLQVVLRAFELPPRPINAVLTHNRLMASKVRLLLEFLVEHLAESDFKTIP